MFDSFPKMLEVFDAQHARIANLEAKLTLAVKCLDYIDKKCWFDPKEHKYACISCDVNQGLIDEHDSWCIVLKAHETIKALADENT
jgi:hypothetical protein